MGLCPYQSMWRPDKPTSEVLNAWEGIGKNPEVMEFYLNNQLVLPPDMGLDSVGVFVEETPKKETPKDGDKKWDFDF